VKAAIVLVVLLTGCAHQDVQRPQPISTNTTVYRLSTPTCEVPEPSDDKLKQALKSRDEWKRYAESLEQLPAAKPSR